MNLYKNLSPTTEFISAPLDLFSIYPVEHSINTPADYHFYTQAPITGSLSLPFVGFASWLIMSIASFLTYIGIGGGLGDVYFPRNAGFTLTQGLLLTLMTGIIMSIFVGLLAIYNNKKFIAKTNICNLNEPESVSKWLYLFIYAFSALLILISPYLINYSQIHDMVNLNLPKFITLVDEYPTLIVLDYQGVLLNFTQFGSWTLKTLNFIWFASLAMGGARMGSILGSLWLNLVINKLNINKQKASYISLAIIILGMLIFIYTIQPLLPFNGKWCDVKFNPQNFYALKICLRISVAILWGFGFNQLLLKITGFSLYIYNYIYKTKKIYISALWKKVCIILSVTVFVVYILNDLSLLISLKGFISTFYSGPGQPPKGLGGLISQLLMVLKSVINVTGDFILKSYTDLYNFYHMIMSSVFPNYFPPLPGNPSMKLDKLIIFLLKNFLVVTCISRVFFMVYMSIKLISYLIIIYYPNFTIKYLFYFNKDAQIVWGPCIDLTKTNNNTAAKAAYKSYRRVKIQECIWLMLKTILSGFIRWAIVVIINYHGF
jgi:hypothetical protein